MPRNKTGHSSKTPTMQDVARLAGVSQSTVSRVLSDTTSLVPVSDETKEKIFNAVAQLGYQPNLIARSLRTQHTQMIAVMIGDISNAFYHPIVRMVQDIASSYDYDVLISNSDHVYENEKNFLNTVLRRPVDGIIMSPHRLSTEDLDAFIKRSHIPIVGIGAQTQHPLIDVIGGTSEPATYQAISWLIHKGHRRIGFIGVADDVSPGPPRLRGYQRAMADAGLIVEPGFVQKVEFTLAGGQQAMRLFLQQSEPPTAIFACNGLMAIGAMDVAQEAGYRIPDDFSLIGFDDIPEASIVRPKLTVIGRDLSAIGRQAIELLLERINGEVTGEGRYFQSEWTLIERASVREL